MNRVTHKTEGYQTSGYNYSADILFRYRTTEYFHWVNISQISQKI